jgi:hypothetical protein
LSWAEGASTTTVIVPAFPSQVPAPASVNLP